MSVHWDSRQVLEASGENSVETKWNCDMLVTTKTSIKAEFKVNSWPIECYKECRIDISIVIP